MFTGYRVGEKSVLLRFDHSESLAAQGGPPVGFEQSDVNGDWQPVEPQIRNDRVVVPINAKQSPTAIRYAWENLPTANLVNGSGLPASPFLTEILAGKPSNDDSIVAQRDAPPKKRTPAPADLTNSPLDSADILPFPGSTNQLAARNLHLSKVRKTKLEVPGHFGYRVRLIPQLPIALPITLQGLTN